MHFSFSMTSFGWLISCLMSLMMSGLMTEAFEFQTGSPVEHLTSVAMTEPTTVGDNFTHSEIEARSNRVRRDMFYFPRGSSLTMQFKLKSDIYSSTTTSTKVTTDQRLEIKFKLPSRSSRRKRSASSERSSIYSSLIRIMDGIGIDGHHCMLRAVCEASETPMEEYGLLGEVLGVLLGAGHIDAEREANLLGDVPSSHKYSTYADWNSPDDLEDLSRNIDYCGLEEFIQAENYGRQLGGCWTKYSKCKIPMRTLLFNAISSLSQNNHLLHHDEL